MFNKKSDIKFKKVGKMISFSMLSGLLVSPIGASVNSSVNLALKAVIQEKVSLSLANINSANQINLNISQNDIPVARFVEFSNSSQGYLLKARSENDGKIKNFTNNNFIPYYIRFNGGHELQLSELDQVLNEQQNGDLRQAANRSITISHQAVASANLKSGSYEDIIILTVESK